MQGSSHMGKSSTVSFYILHTSISYSFVWAYTHWFLPCFTRTTFHILNLCFEDVQCGKTHLSLVKVEERVVVNDIAKLQNPTEISYISQWDLTLFENIWVNCDVIAIFFACSLWKLTTESTMSLTCSTISLNIKATVTLLPSLRLGDYEVNQWRQPIVQPKPTLPSVGIY